MVGNTSKEILSGHLYCDDRENFAERSEKRRKELQLARMSGAICSAADRKGKGLATGTIGKETNREMEFVVCGKPSKSRT